MKALVLLLICYLFLLETSNSQTISYSGRKFVNEKLDQITFLNDSVIVSSFRVCSEKYDFRNDSLILTIFSCPGAGFEPRHAFKLLRQSTNDFAIVYTSYSDVDTMVFVDVEKRVIQLNQFDSIRVDSYGWAGFGRIIIRSDKTVKFAEDFIMPNEQPGSYKQFKLTDQQYQNFLETLSKSLIFMLPEYRGDCGIDITDTDFYIHTNGISIISKGSCLSPIHWKLVEYLYNNIATGK